MEGVAPGNPVRIWVDAISGTLNGRVVWIDWATGANFALVPEDVTTPKGRATGGKPISGFSVILNRKSRRLRVPPPALLPACDWRGPSIISGGTVQRETVAVAMHVFPVLANVTTVSPCFQGSNPSRSSAQTSAAGSAAASASQTTRSRSRWATMGKSRSTRSKHMPPQQLLLRPRQSTPIPNSPRYSCGGRNSLRGTFYGIELVSREFRIP